MLLLANVPVTAVSTLVNTPAKFVPVYCGAWKVGCWMQGDNAANEPAPEILAEASASSEAAALSTSNGAPWWQRWQDAVARAGKPLLLGALTSSVVFSLLAYTLVSAGWRLRVQRTRSARLDQSQIRPFALWRRQRRASQCRGHLGQCRVDVDALHAGRARVGADVGQGRR